MVLRLLKRKGSAKYSSLLKKYLLRPLRFRLYPITLSSPSHLNFLSFFSKIAFTWRLCWIACLSCAMLMSPSNGVSSMTFIKLPDFERNSKITAWFYDCEYTPHQKLVIHIKYQNKFYITHPKNDKLSSFKTFFSPRHLISRSRRWELN